jgi:hypothetical protein
LAAFSPLQRARLRVRFHSNNQNKEEIMKERKQDDIDIDDKALEEIVAIAFGVPVHSLNAEELQRAKRAFRASIMASGPKAKGP